MGIFIVRKISCHVLVYERIIFFFMFLIHLWNQQLVKQLHLYCLNTFIQSRALSVEFPEMMSEVIAAQLPKILAGMVKPLLFHKKWMPFLSLKIKFCGMFVFLLVRIMRARIFTMFFSKIYIYNISYCVNFRENCEVLIGFLYKRRLEI